MARFQVSLLLAFLTIFLQNVDAATPSPATLAQEVSDMFNFAFDSYMTYGFPRDELKPISCQGADTFKGFFLTLIDSLDSLAVFGRQKDFEEGVAYLLARPKMFDRNVDVSVFETNIRLLGGLLSAHLLASNKTLNLIRTFEYDRKGHLLALARDLGERLLRAFQTPSGLPYGTVNLKTGPPPRETTIVCSACCATFALEFGMLSQLTGDPRFADAAKAAARKLWSKRSHLGLIGTHIDLVSTDWAFEKKGSIGGDIDSVVEYFWKAGEALDDSEYRQMYQEMRVGIEEHLRVETQDELYYVDAHLTSGEKTMTVRSLAAFYPGVEAEAGNIPAANKSLHSYRKIWKHFGFLPEGFCLYGHHPHLKRKGFHEGSKRGVALDGYPLRPEYIESIYLLYRKTRDPTLLEMGHEVLVSLRTTRTNCGYAAVVNLWGRVNPPKLRDTMDSFFLAESLKYLYLLFTEESHWAHSGYVFTTEAHLFPINAFNSGKRDA